MGLIKTQYVILYSDLDEKLQDKFHEVATVYGFTQDSSIALGNLIEWNYLDPDTVKVFETECSESNIDKNNVVFIYDW